MPFTISWYSNYPLERKNYLIWLRVTSIQWNLHIEVFSLFIDTYVYTKTNKWHTELTFVKEILLKGGNPEKWF